ncbi:ATP-dependent helicase BRM isoform X2 [Asparagus officinalis]|uniref:ATP-dependent helicase BRM isoform X2 n=1 Tax=Asparagus officinalis TaxID=4686 RepID=UPI00098DE441|nr:ATP-dependent helicase BRM isoform X2 [Asparagus officinalis]
MQSGGRSHGRDPRTPSSSSPSPSPSSSAVSNQLGFESSQQQQQLNLMNQQSQQQQLLRKPEGENPVPYKVGGGAHGVVSASNFPTSSSAISASNALMKFNDSPHQRGARFHEDNQNKGHGQDRNSVYQAHLQFALEATQQQKSHRNMLVQQQGKPVTFHGEKMEQGHASNYQRNDLKPPQNLIAQQTPTSMVRSLQSVQAQASMENTSTSQLLMAQFQAWAMERNIDLSLPGNAYLIAQLLPRWQSSRLAAMQKPNESGTMVQQLGLPSSKQQVLPSSLGGETSTQGNCANDLSGQAAKVKSQQTPPIGSTFTGGAIPPMRINNIQMQQQLSVRNRDIQIERVDHTSMHPPQSSGSPSHSLEHSGTKNKHSGAEAVPSQHLMLLEQLNQPPPQPPVPSGVSPITHSSSQGGQIQGPQQHTGFTKQQFHVLKAQILAFRRLKRGEGALPQEFLQAIIPPPLDMETQQEFHSPGTSTIEKSVGKIVEEHAKHVNISHTTPQLAPPGKGHVFAKEESVSGKEKAAVVNHLQGSASLTKEPLSVASRANPEQKASVSVKAEQNAELDGQSKYAKSDYNVNKGKMVPIPHSATDSGQVNKSGSNSSALPSRDVPTQKFHGPLFDFSSFTSKAETFASSSGLALAYDLKDLLYEEGVQVLNKKRTENQEKISGLLAINLERKRIRPDLFLRLQIEEKKINLLDLQTRLKDELDQYQQEIMAMPDKPYRKFVRQCERQRIELSRQVQQLRKATREKQLKSIFQWRKKLLEVHWAVRDARTTRNRGVAKYHERMLREFSKRKDDHRNKRMEALKNNDVDRYREMLLEQQTNVPGDASQRYAVLSSFLSQTEEYLHKLGGKITAAKNHQEVEEAAKAAAAAALCQGLSEEEVKAAAMCAGDEVMIRNRFSEMNAPRDSTSDNKYYNLAHAVNERVLRQPSMLRAGTLRDYQLVGLQWMLSLYNNKLNGILADEMGLGKTVQVMALIAYLMEFKGNYGPHLIIVPNAVLVNWKSELHKWLPSVHCIFYVGAKEQRARLFSHEVSAMKFNILVTTYEFVMYDRSKLCKIDWKYIIIDEAQRMKDRESVLARDLDRYHCQRRLLLTGTPLQNDLKELWSLLNLLLPEVFDNKKAFHDWFSKPFQKDVPSHGEEEDDWLETEKKVIIIHRLHQILEPFMLRRRVEDVEGSLPPKVPIVLRCRMSAIQGAIYDWIKSTGTIKVDPEDELRRAQKNPTYQVKTYKNLNNRCMELRKACNHPLLNYPYFNDYSIDFLVRSCGKLWILDRILIKLHRAGHRVLLFSTMTKLLDILEEYLQWRRLVYRRIDGTTSLEDRESAIVDFNSPDSDCFIFLLSIRAAGRGLNLQTADTVVIYDPDPNPQNEEQAVARAHRIGQTREVKVIYMEAVVDKYSSYQKEDNLRTGGSEELEEDLAGKDRYMGSIESLIRSNIQQYKIEMADEVINAGRFDQRTTHEERRMTLETLLHDEERYQETVHDVPSLEEVNRMIARNEEEIELFDQMDEEFDWTEEMITHNQVPKWLRAGSRELDLAVAKLSKKPSKNVLDSSIELEANGISPNKAERRGRRAAQKNSIYRELDEDDFEDSESSSVEGNASSLQEEEREVGESEDDLICAVDMQPGNDDQLEEGLVCVSGGREFSHAMVGNRNAHQFEEAAVRGSSSGARRVNQSATPSIMSSRKFGSLSALDAKPNRRSKGIDDELEEGQIAASSDSYMDHQLPGSWNHECNNGDDEQVLQPKIKRKRSMRIRPKLNIERLEEKFINERGSLHCGSQLAIQVDLDSDMQSRNDPEFDELSKPGLERHDLSNTLLNRRHDFPSRSSHINIQKSSRLREDAMNNSREIWNSKIIYTDGTSSTGSKMSDGNQRKCKNVISKLKRKISKDGYQTVPVLYDLWKRNESSSLASPSVTENNPLDLRRINHCLDNLEYSDLTDFIADVQLMLRNVVQYCNYSYEVKHEARKFHDIFFDIMKIAFPDTDLRDSRNSFTFPTCGGSPSVAATTNQSKRQRTIIDLEPSPATAKPNTRASATPDEEERITRTHASKLNNESPLAHPGDLVICKKRRQDRRVGPASPSSQGRASPLSRGTGQQTTRWAQQQGSGGAGGLSPGVKAEAQWAKPVKRMRTDTGKRRHGHM